MDKNICAQLYTVRDFCKTLSEFAETVKKVAAIGYKTVQVSGIGEKLLAGLRDYAAAEPVS